MHGKMDFMKDNEGIRSTEILPTSTLKSSHSFDVSALSKRNMEFGEVRMSRCGAVLLKSLQGTRSTMMFDAK